LFGDVADGKVCVGGAMREVLCGWACGPCVTSHVASLRPFSPRSIDTLGPAPAAHRTSSMDVEKLARMADSVRTGGKGSVRRKKKAIPKTTTTTDEASAEHAEAPGCQHHPGPPA
jgi:hypothetical protein